MTPDLYSAKAPSPSAIMTLIIIKIILVGNFLFDFNFFDLHFCLLALS
jgi:hypothetical protein